VATMTTDRDQYSAHWVSLAGTKDIITNVHTYTMMISNCCQCQVGRLSPAFDNS